jgi:hypothetical protein
MAWRIHDHILRGEVDNRERGVVRGRIWVRGVANPILLELKGNACADLAGCILTFKNPGKTIAMPTDARLAEVQCGTIGDLTASRKVRVLELPLEEAYDRKKQGLPVPEHLANCLYLEWFSQANGRVVIESADYQLAISAPVWRLSPGEETERRNSAAEGFAGFMGKLSQAIDDLRHKSEDEEREWDEFDYEQLLRESDARTNKYAELLDKYKDSPDRDRLIAQEMGWTKLVEALDERETTGADIPREETDEMDAAATGELRGPNELEAPPPLEPDAETEGVDWIRAKDGEVGHPLSMRVFAKSMTFWHHCEKRGLLEGNHEDLEILVEEYQVLGAKLAGALDGLAYGRQMTSGAFVVATLKRALAHLHIAQSALEKVTSKELLSSRTLGRLRTELFFVREEILRLMAEFRGLGPG